MEREKFLPIYQEKWLPSMNKQYPANFALSYVPYSWGDLSQMNNSSLDWTQFYKLVLDGVEVLGVDKYDLTYNDVVYLAWRRKTATLGESLVIAKTKCSHCGEFNNKQIELTKDVQFTDSEVPKLPIKTVIAKHNVEFKYLTIGQFLELDREGKLEDEIAGYAKCISNYPFEEAYQIVYNADIKELTKLDKIEALLYHGVKPTEVKCSKCKKEYTFVLTNSEEVELNTPFRGSQVDEGSEISFG